jgi:uncharacterized Zn-finger protein
MPYTSYTCTICREPITKYSGRCDVCDNSSKRQDKRNLNNLYDVLGEKPPSKKPRRTDNSGDSSALSRQNSHRHHAGSSSNPNYSSGAPPAPSPLPLQDPAQRHKTRPTEHRPVPPPAPTHPSQTQGHQCPSCYKKFKEKSNLNKHIKAIHEGLRPYKCEQCDDASFKSRDNLNVHVRYKHEEQKPFACEICGLQFKEKGNLDKHVKTVHENQRPHKCNQCPAAFGERSGLNKHVKTVHENQRPHKCNQCPAAFGYKSKLNRHLREVHKTDPSATNRPPANQHESSGSRHPPRPPHPSR